LSVARAPPRPLNGNPLCFGGGVLAQIGLTFSWVPFVVIAALALSYVASMCCGVVALIFIAERNPRMERSALWIALSGTLVMCGWLALVIYWMPTLSGLRTFATLAGSIPLALCAIALRFALGRRRA
jgi:hypothetical protein